MVHSKIIFYLLQYGCRSANNVMHDLENPSESLNPWNPVVAVWAPQSNSHISLISRMAQAQACKPCEHGKASGSKAEASLMSQESFKSVGQQN